MTNKDFLQNVGMELKVARIRKRMSIIEISKLTGLSTDCLNYMEGGKHDTKILNYKKYADALEVSLKDIIV